MNADEFPNYDDPLPTLKQLSFGLNCFQGGYWDNL